MRCTLQSEIKELESYVELKARVSVSRQWLFFYVTMGQVMLEFWFRISYKCKFFYLLHGFSGSLLGKYDLYVQLMLGLTKTTKWTPAVKLQHHKLCITFSLEFVCIQLVMQKKWINIFVVQSNLLLHLFYIPGIADTITQIRRLKPFITKNK